MRSAFQRLAARKFSGQTGSPVGYATPVGGDGRLGYADPGCQVLAVDESRCSVRAVISTVDQDRDGDVVIPEGCLATLDNYRRNPVVFFGHQSIPFPIGTSEDPVTRQLSIDVEPGKRITATTWFSQATPEAMQVFALVKERTIRGTSVGFLPIEAERLPGTYRKARLQRTSDGEEGHGFLITTWELLEFSWVGVPVNPFCEQIRGYLSRGKINGDSISPVMRKALEPYAAPRKAWSPGASNGQRKGATMTQAVATKGAGMPEPQDIEQEAETTQEESQEDSRPHSAQVAGEVMEHIRAMKEYLRQVLPKLEQPDIKALAEKYMAVSDDMVADWHDTASSVHPDEDFGRRPTVTKPAETDEDDAETRDEEETDKGEEVDEPDKDADALEVTGDDDDATADQPLKKTKPAPKEDDEEDDDDDEYETRGGKRWRKKSRRRSVAVKGSRYMSAACRKMCKEASEYLDESSEHPDMHKSFKWSNKYHAKCLKEISMGGASGRPTDAPPDGSAPAGDGGGMDVEEKGLDFGALGAALENAAQVFGETKAAVTSLTGRAT